MKKSENSSIWTLNDQLWYLNDQLWEITNKWCVEGNDDLIRASLDKFKNIQEEYKELDFLLDRHY